MRRQVEGSRAVTEAVARCRPEVLPAHPVASQTHIVEALGAMCRDGTLAPCEFVAVESGGEAMSAAVSASATGSRTYTATASSGLLSMAEGLFTASALGLPVVLTVTNRTITTPITVFNDHGEPMSQRDCGWVQLYAADNQQAVDLHVLAFRLAEELSMPVMVCVDGFAPPHAIEPLDVPSQEQVDAFLPRYQPRRTLDPEAPTSIGAMIGPDAFTEARYLSHRHLTAAQGSFPLLAARYAETVGRSVSRLDGYHTERADTVVVALGSVTRTVKEVAHELGDVGVLTLTMYRPFPYVEVRNALARARRIVVLERAFSPGAVAPLTADVRAALTGTSMEIHTVVAGLGGRAVSEASLREMLTRPLGELTFLDLRHDLVDKALRRAEEGQISGPRALNIRPGVT